MKLRDLPHIAWTTVQERRFMSGDWPDPARCAATCFSTKYVSTTYCSQTAQEVASFTSKPLIVIFPDVSLCICSQEECADQEDVLRPYSFLPYAWDEPALAHRLVVALPGNRKLGTFSLDQVSILLPGFWILPINHSMHLQNLDVFSYHQGHGDCLQVFLTVD